MCTTCGCGDGTEASVTNLQTGETQLIENLHNHEGDSHIHSHSKSDIHSHGEHTHSHEHPHAHSHEHHTHDHTHSHSDLHIASHAVSMVAGAHAVTVEMGQAILAKNNQLAERNRAWFEGREILALNLVSSPGAGKTTLLERTIRDLKSEIRMSVIEGDQQTLNDAERIKAAGVPVVQINTGTGCHLEADMVKRGLDQLRPEFGSLLFIENVGNLVCPALFDLGERAKVVILSVTEGDDKPIKYPHMFRAAELMIISKIDLAPYVRFDMDRCDSYARDINPGISSIRLSAETGDGIAAWYDWLRGSRIHTSLYR